jgi:hypothetical protein
MCWPEALYGSRYSSGLVNFFPHSPLPLAYRVPEINRDLLVDGQIFREPERIGAKPTSKPTGSHPLDIQNFQKKIQNFIRRETECSSHRELAGRDFAGGGQGGIHTPAGRKEPSGPVAIFSNFFALRGALSNR